MNLLEYLKQKMEANKTSRNKEIQRLSLDSDVSTVTIYKLTKKQIINPALFTMNKIRIATENKVSFEDFL